MTTFRRLALLLSLLLAVLPAHAQTARKKSTRKKAVTTKVSKKKPGKAPKQKTPPEEDDVQETDEVDSTEPMVFGDSEDTGDARPTPKPPPPAVAQPKAPPAATEPAKPTVAQPLTRPSVAAAAGPLALFSVARTPDLADAAQKLEGELTHHLKKGGDVQFVDLALAFPAQEPVVLTKADGLYEEGRAAYDNLDPEAAESRFRAAAEAYEKAPADLRVERLGETYLFLGASRMLNGDTAGAREAFLRSVVADPAARPDAALFGQDVQKAFDEARAETKARAAGTLMVQSQPEGAQVRVHGRDVGVTPLAGVAVPAGHHPVLVVMPGHEPYAEYVEVKPSGAATVKASLAPVPGLVALRESAARSASAAAFEAEAPSTETLGVADRLDARYLVLTAVSHDKKGRLQAELQAWDVLTRARLRGVSIDLTGRDPKKSAAAAAEQVRTFMKGELAPKAGQGSPVASDSVLRKPWFWAVVGGAAAVTAGAVFVATQDKGRPFNPVSGGIGF
ncbi:PEGA domain-containing protein [Myxococcus sp. K15C18031901]|uniref:PEGA domain-containing protein n=1 Tax=Myxococcus dinghuensis TaxID=2906761 RepID=UPI0020A713D3|nr:PEGA domain-containing protein [Myxococcus dinghuensis]MCP3097653.1 PEGA domain-containing protein [Myxococcus dinghuensis]